MKMGWLVLALLATMCCLATAAHADWGFSVSPWEASAAPGEAITYNVDILNNDPWSLQLRPVTLFSPFPDST